MINFILYEDNTDNTRDYISIINKFMLNKNMNYKIHSFDKYTNRIISLINKSIDGRNVFILDVEVPGMNGIDLARLIRSYGDWYSQIIIVTAYDKKKYYSLTSRLLMLDFINKKNLTTELFLCLDVAWKIFFKDKKLSYKYNGEIINIFYNDIYYIEKNIHNNISTIVTGNNEYIIRSSINNIMKVFNSDSRFFKTHRSCIINLDNVCKYDIKNNIVCFRNKSTNLVARDKKKTLKSLLTRE